MGCWRLVVCSVIFLSVLSLRSGSAVAGFKMPVAPEWGSCALSASESKTIRVFRGDHYLQCGGPRWSSSPTWGYRHIVRRHKGQYQFLAGGAFTQRNWRDLVDFTIDWNLKDPDVFKYTSGGKVCRSRKFYFANDAGRVILVKIFRVITDDRTKRIITAYPGPHC